MGMAGVMAGVMHAPLMAIFLTAEMTGGYDLFLPLLIVSASSYAISRIFIPYGIYTRRLAKRGELLTHQKDRTVLTLLKMDSVIERDFSITHPEMSLKEMVDIIAHSHRNLFPVVNDKGELIGVVQLDDIRNIMFQPRLYERMTVADIMIGPLAKIHPDMNMAEVMNLFDNTNAWSLPLIDQSGQYIGMLSKSHIFKNYRSLLKDFSED